MNEVITELTFDQKEAIRECRFKTTNVARSKALIYDGDMARIEATGLSFTRYERAPKSSPGIFDYEVASSDPVVIDFVAGLPSKP